MVKQINTKGGNVSENEMLCCGAQFLFFKKGLFVLLSRYKMIKLLFLIFI